MKLTKAVVFSLVLTVSATVLADWVVAPVVPAGENLAPGSLQNQYKRLLQYWELGNYSRVSKICDRLLKIAPHGHPLVEELYFLKAEALYQMEKLPGSQEWFAKLLKEYPHTGRLPEVTKRQLDIARAYLGNYRRKLWGLPLYRIPSRGIKMLTDIFERDPYGAFADDAQMELANYYFRKQDYLEAGERYKLVLANYPRTEFRELAAFRWAQSIFLDGRGQAYDPSYLTESRQAFQSFLARFPQSRLAPQAHKRLEKIKELQARKAYHTASFYHQHQYLEAALCYYRITATRFPETRWAQKAKEKIHQLTGREGPHKQ